MRRRRLSIRARVLSAVLLTVLLAQLGSVLVLRQVLVSALDTRVEASLAREAEELRRLAAGVDPQTGAPFGSDVRALVDAYLSRDVPGEREAVVALVAGAPYPADRRTDLVDDADVLRGWAADTSRRDRVRVDGRRVDYLAVPVPVPDGAQRAVFLAMYDYEGERAEIDAALRQSELVALLSLLAVAAAAGAIVTRATAPLPRLTAAVHSIGSGHDLSRRLPEPRGDDELATLTRTFNAMLDRLEDVFARQHDFIADAGHELRTPITIVRGHLEVLGPDPLEQRETVALVTGELDRMARMVEDMLTLARLGRPDFLLPERLEVRSLLEQVCAKARAVGHRAWSLSGSPEVAVVADRHRLTQALMQLATNAVRHTRPGDPIVFGGAVARERLYLWVSDAGTGVPPDDHERIFERFARTSSSRRRGPGSGLGLAIVSAIAAAHAGDVSVMSAEGAGATFTLVLPLHPGEDP